MCLPCTCFPARSWNSNKSHHIFVCARYPVCGHGKGRGPAEISFTNRWELAGPLGWEARFSSFSQERCRIYWFSGEKKITIQTSSLQFLGACRKSHPIYVMAPFAENFFSFADMCGLRVERWWMWCTFATCASTNGTMLICFILKPHPLKQTNLSFLFYSLLIQFDPRTLWRTPAGLNQPHALIPPLFRLGVAH